MMIEDKQMKRVTNIRGMEEGYKPSALTLGHGSAEIVAAKVFK